MPGPGGGSRGGGFGGGSRGGGFGGSHGGGFGGPRGPRPHFYGGWRHRHYGYGYGGGLLSILMGPIIILLFTVVFLVIMVSSAFTTVINGGHINYDEKAFQDYANRRYEEEFPKDLTYEDNLLIVIATNEEADGYYCIAWVGDNVHSKINLLFGDEYTEFGQTVHRNINDTYYAYSLDTNLVAIMDHMTQEVVNLNLESSHTMKYDHSQAVRSHITNHTELDLTESIVNASLESFTEQTDIPAVIVVDTMENIFGKNIPLGDILIMIVLLVIVAVAVYLIIRNVRQYKAEKKKNDEKKPPSNDGSDGNYNRDYRGSYNQDEHTRNNH